MKKPWLKTYLKEFYEKHKNNNLLISKDEIIKLRKRNKFEYYFIDVFTHQSPFGDPNSQNILDYYINDVLFGFKSGIIVCRDRVVDIVEEIYYETKDKTYHRSLSQNSHKLNRFSLKKEDSLHEELDKVFKLYFKDLSDYNINLKNQQEKKFKTSKENLIKDLDKDRNGIIDIIEINDDFKNLLSKHQEIIIETDKKYIHNLVKISNYLKEKRNNIQLIFDKIVENDSIDDHHEYTGILKNEIYTYELILLHSLSMVVSIKEKDLITFYEIYEQFDKLKIFESNWEKEISESLKDISKNLGELIYSINEMNFEIINKLDELNYITEKSFNNLSDSISNELQSINSSIDTNTLVNTINTYQVYKLRK